ncbi:MAG TPA: VOC family protein [Miltoncostaeaceae bacterium]|nr:VOC family protein [Miltoncostaeaceae bacterium]
MARLIHSMIRVRDEDRALDFYRRAFGLEVVDRVEFDTFGLLYLRTPDGPFELELTVNADREDPYDLGDGYGHLAVSVDDLDAEHARMTAEGLAPDPLKTLERGEFSARYFFMTDPDGYRIEVLQRGGRFV